MEIMLSPTGTYSSTAVPLEDPHPEVELAPPHQFEPIVIPRQMSPLSSPLTPEITRLPSVRPKLGPRARADSIATDACAKRESYNMTGTTFLVTNDGRTLKLPVASESKADPLNWSGLKTAGAFFAIVFYSAVCLTVAQAPAVMLDSIQNTFKHENIAPWLIKALVTGPALFMGIGCFVWVPLSIGLGRRPTVLVATMIVLIATLGASQARTFAQLVVASCFIGLSEGLGLCLAFLIVIDLTYINQRPQAIAFMWCVAGCFGTSGVALAPVIAHHGQNWRQFYYFWTIPVVVSLFVTFALYPETYFKRPTVAFNGLILMQSATEKLTIYQDREVDSSIYRDLPEYPVRKGLAGFRDRVGLSRSPFASWSSAGRCYLQMAYCACNPLLFWVFVASGFNSASMIFIGATNSRILTSPPYNLSVEVVGTVYAASGVGALIGLPVCWIVICNGLKRLSQRNHGVLEAEHYLIAYFLPIIVGALSSLIYGLAVKLQWHWIFLYLAYGGHGFSLVTLMTANTLWVAEAFPRWAAPALAVVIGGCYFISFAMSFALVPWVEAHGYLWVGIELMIFQILGGLVALPVAFWGKGMRQAIAGRWSEDRSGALRPL
ncbi:hypothetical protein COCC4DRAFT_206258 [Bipolaris maydis ATCC 48331]|uniref:Major facilitator superfamily (MFS) profile domain-containing protein n=2 Tax=Cochliobolus heterostrophus TaxID=5016 RepID=M2UZJ8_COCH5|nr:uncharacterized protein COCC4DRAFT_206258 [Bipolaris maydis ATCC 48331]EMD93147.1 hypothetical protein COCHEDRAFT_1193454 [Bipolaris maydis C5]KAJ5025813.1 major facilitator superfamily domain-containing protein [Bipolaris maydis]ENI00259.1 hypothetical protein COCC4DRAFT_206258 [Bipolaris maydis ATCC 48331]KAJ5037151.1 major facilitator superfamily domain-containing protein [Bipolaris maydis]KAJ5056343.1 major facilitator superfamily domain-containing protein [Bipolaris maydis]